MIGDFIDEIIDELAEKRAKDIDNVIIDFLKKNGYRPKKTKKYAENLRKKLKRKGLVLAVREVVLDERYNCTNYYKKVAYIPMFIHIENGGNNGNTKDI